MRQYQYHPMEKVMAMVTAVVTEMVVEMVTATGTAIVPVLVAVEQVWLEACLLVPWTMRLGEGMVGSKSPSLAHQRETRPALHPPG